jgi:hypothetical protein
MSVVPGQPILGISPNNATMEQYNLAYQISPIFLAGGIVASSAGGLVPLTTFTGGSPATAEEAFATFVPMPGSTLISQTVAMYPFANQNVAANATIQQPLTLSMLMIAPVNQAGGYGTKLSTFTALQKTFANHNAAGGTYTVATPAFIYNGLLLVSWTDVTEDLEGGQQMIKWQLDFIQPLLTLAAAAGAMSSMMSQISNGQQTANPPAWSGASNVNPANQAGAPAGLGNVIAALAAFGGSVTQ